eukprot:11944-Chlamydomonas_euryale.AAC.1
MTSSVALMAGMPAMDASGDVASWCRPGGSGVGATKRVTRMDVPSASTPIARTTRELQLRCASTPACFGRGKAAAAGGVGHRTGVVWRQGGARRQRPAARVALSMDGGGARVESSAHI